MFVIFLILNNTIVSAISGYKKSSKNVDEVIKLLTVVDRFVYTSKSLGVKNLEKAEDYITQAWKYASLAKLKSIKGIDVSDTLNKAISLIIKTWDECKVKTYKFLINNRNSTTSMLITISKLVDDLPELKNQFTLVSAHIKLGLQAINEGNSKFLNNYDPNDPYTWEYMIRAFSQYKNGVMHAIAAKKIWREKSEELYYSLEAQLLDELNNIKSITSEFKDSNIEEKLKDIEELLEDAKSEIQLYEPDELNTWEHLASAIEKLLNATKFMNNILKRLAELKVAKAEDELRKTMNVPGVLKDEIRRVAIIINIAKIEYNAGKYSEAILKSNEAINSLSQLTRSKVTVIVPYLAITLTIMIILTIIMASLIIKHIIIRK